MATSQRLIFIIGKRAHAVKPLCGAPSATITVFPNRFEGLLYRHLERRLAQQIRDFLRQNYGLELSRRLSSSSRPGLSLANMRCRLLLS